MNNFFKSFFLLLGFLLINNAVFSQEHNFIKTETFIENVGQFDGRDWQNSEIKYAYSHNPFYIFFTNEGLTYRFDKIIKNPNRMKGDTTVPKRVNISELINVTWIGANENVDIIEENVASNYYSFAIKNGNEVINKNNVKGYQKIMYKNLYDNIDVEYTIHSEGGVKYNLILHPGADISQVKLKYTARHTQTKDESISIQLNNLGQVEINTSLGKIIEHAPVTFYDGNNQKINSDYKFENNILSFELEDYDHSNTIVIDPWILSPFFNSSTAVWEVETDGAGNVYVIGGETPMELNKYNAAGTLQWTYTTPWDTNSVWLGTLATDNVGTSYVTSGTSPEIERVDNAGNMIWHTNGSGGLNSDEFWSITFNCDKSKLLVGGTRFQNLFDPYAAIFDIDVATGSVLSFATFAYTDLTVFGATPVEVRSISSTRNARYAYLTHNDVGTINQNLGSCPTNEPYYEVDNGHNLAYKCEDYLPATQNGGGLKALVANNNFIYTNSGSQIFQRDLNTGALVNTVNLPGGSSTTTILGGIVVSNSGLAVDDCGNVYAGSNDRVVKFDQNLNILSQANTTFSVYDVSVNSNGEVIAVGAQQDNSATNRNGRIESINMGACAQFALICCDANVCPVDTMCVTDPSVLMVPNTPGGTWSGPGVDATGNFDPAVAGIGVHTITYTLVCGSGSFNIVVNSCATLTACLETNGDVTVSGGTGPYTWESWEIVGQSCNGTIVLGNCIGTWVDDYAWVTFGGNSNTETPPNTNSQIQITESGGSVLNIADVSTLAACSVSCDATITPAGPFCTTDAPVNLTAVDGGGTWSGTGITDANLGTFDPATAGVGTHTITYVISGSCGATDTETITVNAADDASFTYISSSFCLTDPNPVPNSITTAGGTFTIDNGGTINATTGEINIGSSGAGTFIVTYTTSGTCPSTSTQTVILTNGSDATISAAGPFCTTDAPVNLTAVDGGGTWSGTGITDANLGTFDPATAGVGTHTITYTISGSCGATSNTTIVVNATDDASFSYMNSTYCSSESNPIAIITGTAGGIFTIDNGGTINATTGEINLGSAQAGSYVVTYTTNGVCPASSTFNLTIVNGGNIEITPAGPYCMSNDTVTLTSNISGGTWTGNGIVDGTSGLFSITDAGEGTHTIYYTITGACGGVDSIDVIVNSQPTATVTAPLAIDYGTSTVIVATGGGSYNWIPDIYLSCSDCEDPTATPSQTTTYCVEVNKNGCIDTACTTVTIEYNCGEVFVPTAFSPNGDNANNLECVYGNCIITMNFRVYDRWGELVFESTDPSFCWDGTYKGKLLSSQVFVYLLDATLISGEIVNKKGNISLIR
jgi:gliding motility-associated-like protein